MSKKEAAPKETLPGPSDEVIIKEIRRHMALCGPEFPDCGIGAAMRYIFAQDANLRAVNRTPAFEAMVKAIEVAVTGKHGSYSREAIDEVLRAALKLAQDSKGGEGN